MKGDVGQIRIIEAFLAMFIIFSSLAVSANLTKTQEKTEIMDLAALGLQALVKLDSDGSLSNYIDNQNWSSLRDALTTLLPAGVSFNLTVYNEEMQQLNDVIISNGAFNSQEITFVEHVFASQSPTFRCYIVHLYLAVAK